jgi:hypothetical protein
MATGIAAGAAARAWSPAVMAFDHFLSEGVAPSSLKPSIPPAWDAAILQALSHLGQGGYPSLSAMRSAIEALPTEVIEEPSAGAPDCQAPIQPHDIGTWPRIVDEDEGDTRRPHGPRPVVIAAAAMAVLLVVLASGWFFSGFRNDSAVALSPPTASRTSLARVTGLVSAAHLVAGSAQVHLSWSPIAGADKYRVRIAHPGSKEVTAVTRASYVATHLSAGDRFTWKVAAHAHGRWGPYSTSSTNGVLAGTTVTVFPTPALRSPAQGAHIRVPVKLCWSPQRSSSGYRVLIDGHVWNASRSCLTISANPGRHHWAAAAVHKNAKHRMSPYSRVRTFTLVGNVYNAHPRTASTVAPPIQTVAVAPPVVPTAVIVVPTQVPVVVQQPTIVAVAPTQAPVVVAPQPTAGPSSGSGSQGSGSTSCIPFVNC